MKMSRPICHVSLNAGNCARPLAALVLLLCLTLSSGASAAKILILDSTVASPANTSKEYLACLSLGYLAVDIDIVNNATWAGMTAAQFSSYEGIVLGDPLCNSSTGAVATLTANSNIWGPAVDGNVIVVGTDPTVHPPGGTTLTEKGIAFATADITKTGAYITLSCYYHGTGANTPAPFLDDLSTFGNFTVTGVGCYDNSHIVATHPALSTMTDGDLSNWGCSVHEAFDSWPGDFLVLAIAKDAGNNYTASDGTVGIPYIVARGEGLTPLDPNQGKTRKWSQLPDKTRNGIDVRVDRNDQIPRLLADDFLCTQTGPITCVRFWGSWFQDRKGLITKIHLSIHSDIPAVFDAGGAKLEPSRPGDLLWEMDFDDTRYQENLFASIDPEYEWWWDPYQPDSQTPQGDQEIWEYVVSIPKDKAFIQEGTATDPMVYWLDIYVETANNQGFEETFGWKTAQTHWNDDASFWGPDPLGLDSWQELIYPNGHPFFPESIDLAFEILTEPIHTPEKEACCFEDGTCQDLPVAECLEKNGTPQGAGTDCTTVECPPPPPPLEACCLPDGTCADLTVGQCKKLNGIPQGFGSDCTTVECPQPCQPDPVTCPSGSQSTMLSLGAGFHDDFAAGPDPGANPDVVLQNFIINCSAPGIPLQFDQIPGLSAPANSWFGHTFNGLPFGIKAAKLEIRVRATSPGFGTGSGGVYNDSISFVDSISGCSPTWLWSNRFMNLPESGGSWTPGQTTTFCLDLDALPIGNTASTTSVISDLASGRLSIFVQDDTGVDYAVLTLAVCPCEYPVSISIPVEVADNFNSPDTAPASPSSEITTAYTFSFRGFDQIIPNRAFAHTFSGLPANIIGAQLELRLRAHADIPTNDGLALEFLNPTWRWSRAISTLPPTGTWSAGTTKTVILNLAALPPSTGGVTNIIGDLADGDLDVYIQDDTAIDYMILRLRVCCDDGIPGDNDHDGDVDLTDFAIQAKNYLVGVTP